MLQLLRLTTLLALLTAAAPGPAAAQTPAAAATTPATQPGTLVFKLRPEFRAQASADHVAVPALAAALRRLGATRLRQKFPHALPPSEKKPGSVELRLVYQVWLPADVPLEKARLVLLHTGAVAYAEPLYVRPMLFQPNDPLADSLSAAGQYHLKNIRAYQAWDLTRGDTSICIGVTDTGFRLSHEDLAGQWQRNYQDPPDGLDNDQDGYIDNYRGWDLADNDNNPTYDAPVQPLHGQLVAGAAAARTDNGRGVAGVGFRCRFLPLKIYPGTSSGAFAGYEAVVYAADHGCHIINLSWGGPGGRSEFEQDAISYAAVNRDAVVVAAAGNTPAELDFYPASYEHVLSVGASNAADGKAFFATYGRRLDLLAPGQDVLTTYGDTDADYVAATGSSFAAPLVAGAAALVRARFPQLNAAQVAAQLRRTTDAVDQLPANAAFAGKLGTGRLNVRRAVQAVVPVAARLTARTFAPARNAYPLGDSLRLVVEVQNLMQPAGFSVALASLSPHLTVRQGQFATGPLASLGRATNAAQPFRLAVAGAGVPLNTRAVLRCRLSNGAGYQDDFYLTVLLNPDYAVLDAGDLALTLTSRGSLGYDGLGSDVGEGVSYRGSTPLLYEGGLLLAAGPGRVANRLRSTRPGATDADFFALAQTALRRQPLRATQEAAGWLQDSLPGATRGRTVGVQVRQRGYAWAQAPHRDYVILEYQLKNVTPDTLKPLYAGLFADWDVPPDYARNAVAYDSVRRLSYAYDAGRPGPYVGMQWLRGGAPACYALDVNAPTTAPVALRDGFSRAEKYLTLSTGTRQRSTGLPAGTDIAHVLGAALPRLAPADSAVVAFAVLAAPTLAQLQAAADAAATRYAQVLPVRAALAAGAWQLYPNPATHRARLELPASFGLREVQVLNAVGQCVRRLPAAGGVADVDVRGLPVGVYVVRAQGTAGQVSRRLVVQP